MLDPRLPSAAKLEPHTSFVPQLSIDANSALIAFEPIRVDQYKETAAKDVRLARIRFSGLVRTIPITLVLLASAGSEIAGRDVDDLALMDSEQRAYEPDTALAQI